MLAALKPIFENPTIEKVNQNIKYDQIVLAANGVDADGRGRRLDDRPLPAPRRRADARPRRPDARSTSATRTSRSRN